MLIDARQKTWIYATTGIFLILTAFYFWYRLRSSQPLTGGTTIGLWYGTIGSALMVYAGLLSAHRHLPSWWPIGARSTWLKGHVWLGLLSGWVILLHSGFRWGGPLEVALWVVLILTLATGVVGIALQNLLPRLLTRRVAHETPYEQIPHLCTLLRRRGDALVSELCGAGDTTGEFQSGTRRFYEGDIRSFLNLPYQRTSVLADGLRASGRFAELRTLAGTETEQAGIEELERLCAERRSLGEQERLHHALHGWLLIHVPLSVLLLVFGTLHAFLSLYY